MTQRGFTLIEVLVALAIVAIALMAGLQATTALARNAQRQSDILLAHLGIWSRQDPWAPAVLEPLIARPGAVLSRTQLEEKLFSWKDDVSSNAVEVYIHGVRKKLGAGLIQNVRGLGYLVPVQGAES